MLHLATVGPAFFIGSVILACPKGTARHRAFGKSYLLLMLATGFITLFMNAGIGPRLLNHFGFIHLFSVLTLYSVPAAYFAARRGNIARHHGFMVGLYLGGIVIAGGFAFAPGRTLHSWLLG